MRAPSRPFIFLILLAALTGVTARGELPFSFESTPGQLPKTVIPRHYAIKIRPDLEKFMTHGSEVVDVEVVKPVKEIVLNADLQITGATLREQNEAVANEVTLIPKQDLGRQTVTLRLPNEVGPGKFQLRLEFIGQITEQAQGLFYVKYATPKGKKVMLGTQMEPTDARRMFPCWDEPAFRASFQLTVTVPEKHLAVSNTPIEQEKKLAGGLKEIIFARTPAMASYLMVFVSGELEELKDKAEGVQIRIITTEGKKEQGRYALATTKKLLTYYNQYFGIKYPLPKLDQIAIPGGFDGAMENWGAITYNEEVLLYDPKTSSEHTRQEVFVTVAHEMAHQWFGNLVTTAWWNNLWLNEGFASWMEVKATDHFNPDWQMWLRANAEKSAVMSGDARSTTHPIQRKVENESEANDAFDSITYQKGQAFLRMLESYVGEEVFRKGIHQYLAEHLYANTTTADLWAALEKVSGKPIKNISAGWTEQPGLPVVKVQTDCLDGRQVITLEQERFTVQDPQARPLLWKIPVGLMKAAHPEKVSFALVEEQRLLTGLGDCTGLVKANAGDTGYYRVSYEPALFLKLVKNFSKLPAADQLNLLNDTWAMVEANRTSATSYLDLVESISVEKNFAVWEQILSILDLIDDLELKQSGRGAFQEYACNLLRPQLQRLGWEPKNGELMNDQLLRGQVITTLGYFGDKRVIAEAQTRFKKFLSKPATLPASLRAPVLKIAGRYGDKPTYDHIHELARKAAGTEERQLYYRALAGALNPALALETLGISLTDETVPQEATSRVAEVAQTGEQKELAWEFARQHMKELLARVDAFERNLYVPSILGTFSDTARADELEAYVTSNLPREALQKAREAAAGMRFRAALKQRELPVIDRWIAGQLSNRRSQESAVSASR